MSSISIRRATRSDLPEMASLLINAFAPGPWSRYLFPPHLRVKPGNGDELDFRLHMLSSKFDSPGREHVCATVRQPGEEKEVLVGWAQWIDSKGQADLDEEQRKKKEGEMEAEPGLGAHIPSLDKDALSRLTKEGGLLEKRLAEYLGERGTTHSCCESLLSLLHDLPYLHKLGYERKQGGLPVCAQVLNLLLVSPSYQRRGIGRLLAREGLDRAARENKEVRLRSTPEGRPLYLALGFEDVCAQKVIGETQYGMVWRAPIAAKSTPDNE